MFSVEKPLMLNILAQGAMGGNVPAGSISLYNMLDEKLLENVAKSQAPDYGRDFQVTFESTSAGVLFILMIFHFDKMTISLYEATLSIRV